MGSLRRLAGVFLMAMAAACTRSEVVTAQKAVEHRGALRSGTRGLCRRECRVSQGSTAARSRAQGEHRDERVPADDCCDGRFPSPEGRLGSIHLRQTGKGIAGTDWTLLGALIIDGPLGKTCQIHLRAPEGIAIITELHKAGNTPVTPQDIWLMTCNHADGDKQAEAICRSTLAGFRFRGR